METFCITTALSPTAEKPRRLTHILAMKRKRKQKLRDAILSHIAKSIRGELQDWGNLKVWLDFDFMDAAEEDIATDMFELEASRLCNRIG